MWEHVSTHLEKTRLTSVPYLRMRNVSYHALRPNVRCLRPYDLRKTNSSAAVSISQKEHVQQGLLANRKTLTNKGHMRECVVFRIPKIDSQKAGHV